MTVSITFLGGVSVTREHIRGVRIRGPFLVEIETFGCEPVLLENVMAVTPEPFVFPDSYVTEWVRDAAHGIAAA